MKNFGKIISDKDVITKEYLDSKGYISAITSKMVTDALGFTPFDSAVFTKASIKNALGIADWALAASKPSYDDVYLKLTGGTITGNLTVKGKVSASGLSISTATASLTFTDNIIYSNASLRIYGGWALRLGANATGIQEWTDLKTILGLGSLAYKNSIEASDIPSIAWSKVTGKPTDLAGYGITDALPKSGGTLTGQIFINTASGDRFFRSQSGAYDLAFGIGAGGTNRGIFDFTNSEWWIMRDGDRHTEITGTVGIHTLTVRANFVAPFIDLVGEVTINNDAYVDKFFRSKCSAYEIGFGVGAGNANRGIFDFTNGGWWIVRGSGVDTTINGEVNINGLLTANNGINLGGRTISNWDQVKMEANQLPATTGSQILFPNIHYTFSNVLTSSSNISITLTDNTSGESITRIYYIVFKTGSTTPTFTFNKTLYWKDGKSLTALAANKRYRIVIDDNLAILETYS